LPAAELSAAKTPDEALVELDEVTAAISEPKSSSKPKRSVPKPAARKSNATKAENTQPLLAGDATLQASDAASLRQLLAENPAALEPGLAVYRDADGTPLGAGYASGVGDIDLLASSDAGDLVVVMISEDQGGEELVAEVLQRIGWVRKHVSNGNDRVRGIVLCAEAPESLSYTAAAVADTVRFKTYRVALSFEDLEI
jgi:hypothetical protein